MHVSIIIAAYNAAETIADTIESVLAQTCPDWEVIVVDDGSSDATAEIARGYVERDERIGLISQPNGGESAARNAGIAQAHYDWLLFLDADDWISPAHLERITRELISDPSLDAVHCSYARVASDGTSVVEKYWPPKGDMFSTLARRAAFAVHACIVRRSLVEAVGNFDTSLKKSPDWDLWQRIARTGASFGAVREVLAYYRMQPNAASLDAEQLFYDGLRVLKQGHSPDPRVPNPHPDHAAGLPKEQIQSQEFYLLCWCAGLLLGRGKDANHLLDAVNDDHYPELYPNAVAQCIFEAATLPACQPPQAWETLWADTRQQVEEFLVALEQQSQTPDLARRALTELKRLILMHSPLWGPVIEGQDQTIATQQTLIDRLDQGRVSLEEERDKLQRLARQLEQEKALLERDLDGSGRLVEVLQQAKSQLEEDLAKSGRLAETLQQEKTRLAEDLDKSGRLARKLQQEKTQLEQDLNKSERLTEKLQQEKTQLEQDLNKSERLTEELQMEKTLLGQDLGKSARLVEELGHKKADLEDELGKSRRLAEERASILAELQGETWVRLGLRLGIVKQPAINNESPGVLHFPGSATKSHHPPNPQDFEEEDVKESPFELRVAGGSLAELVFLGDDPETVRIAIKKGRRRKKWDIQLNLPHFNVQSNHSYTVHFRARADRPRNIFVGFARAHDPWDGLGLYKQIKLTSDWQDFQEDFVATQDDENARIHFDVGGSNIAVEVSSVSLRSLSTESSRIDEEPAYNAVSFG